MINQLVTCPEWEKTDCSSIESAGSGAAFLPYELEAKFQSKVTSAFFHGYGSSESVRIPLSASIIPGRFTRQWICADHVDRNDAAR